ncbi:MAG TPA: imidazolonepropionase [Pyrinomonadaceae bacterium]|nr:imidazolonepropionase [Pyrinomonadaceae bacterium]HMP65055.1 imidazolonepropionase [Pyrinomonadaceae bacterium]
MQQADLIVYNIGQLVTCASPDGPKRGDQMRDVGIVENGAFAAADGRFSAVGSTARILNDHNADNKIDAGGRVVCPGFVDPHTHIVYAGDRLNEFEMKIKGAEYLDILAAGGGIISTVRATRAASEEELVEQALTRLDKMLACGTTACEIKTGYGLDTGTELKMLRVIEELDKQHPMDIVPTFLAAHAVPPEFKDDANGYVDLICDEMLPQAWEWYQASHFEAKGIPFYCDVFTERNAFDLHQMRRLLETAASFGFGIKAHVDQFTNLGGSRLGIELNAASIDHLDAISDDEIGMLADSNTIGIVIPTENFNAGKTQFAPARKLIDAGCAVALSTDYNPGSAPCPSMPMAMAISCRYQKLLPAEALNAATINAAHAIGLGKIYGSIELGKRAFWLLCEADDYRQIAHEFGYSKLYPTSPDAFGTQ